jgi:hypothetical protein
MAMTRTNFAFQIDTWTPDGESIVERVPLAHMRITEASIPIRRA